MTSSSNSITSIASIAIGFASGLWNKVASKDTSSPVAKVLFKHPDLREEWEERTGATIPDNAEVSSVPDLKKEVYNETLKVIKQMYCFLKPGGSMIFNVGSVNINLNNLENQIKEILNQKFKSIEIRTYGAFHITHKNPTHRFNRLILAYLMNFFLPLRTFFGFKKRKIYFACKNKI